MIKLVGSDVRMGQLPYVRINILRNETMPDFSPCPACPAWALALYLSRYVRVGISRRSKETYRSNSSVSGRLRRYDLIFGYIYMGLLSADLGFLV